MIISLKISSKNIFKEYKKKYQIYRKLILAKMDQKQNQLVHHDEYKIDELNLGLMLRIMDLIDHSKDNYFKTIN